MASGKTMQFFRSVEGKVETHFLGERPRRQRKGITIEDEEGTQRAQVMHCRCRPRHMPLCQASRSVSTCSIKCGRGVLASDWISRSACPMGRCLVRLFGTATQKIPAAWAAVMPLGESS